MEEIRHRFSLNPLVRQIPNFRAKEMDLDEPANVDDKVPKFQDSASGLSKEPYSKWVDQSLRGA